MKEGNECIVYTKYIHTYIDPYTIKEPSEECE